MRRSVTTAALALAIWAAALGVGPSEAQRAAPSSREQITLSFAPVVKRAAPAVVNIFTRRLVRGGPPGLFDDPLFRRFFDDGGPRGGGQRQRVESSLGSGVIIDPRGAIVTNHHVVKGADEIRVVLADRREFDARIRFSDERTDLAVLDVRAPEPLPHLEFGDSDGLEVGDLVLAIGNPFGVGQTVTSGIVSATSRTRTGITDYGFFIQTDAAINPGNSGGALVTMDGRLAGINTAIFSRTGGSVGIGFAIPSNMVRAVVAGGRADGGVSRPWIGADVQDVTADLAPALGLERPAGAVIRGLVADGPAARAGLRVGDVLVALDGKEIDDVDSLLYRVATLPIGAQPRLTYLREGRRAQTAITLAARPASADAPRAAAPIEGAIRLQGSHPLRGVVVAPITPELAERLGEPAAGVVAAEVPAEGRVARLLRPGDVLLTISGRAIAQPRDVEAALARRTQPWILQLRRAGETVTLRVQG